MFQQHNAAYQNGNRCNQKTRMTVSSNGFALSKQDKLNHSIRRTIEYTQANLINAHMPDVAQVISPLGWNWPLEALVTLEQKVTREEFASRFDGRRNLLCPE